MADAGGSRGKGNGKRTRIAKNLPYEDYLAMLIDNGIDLAGRTLFLSSVLTNVDWEESGTDANMFDRCVKALTLFERQDLHAPITIVTANFGGIIYHALGIVDRLTISPCPIIIHGYGPIMSAGAFILQAGNERLLAPSATMMLHYASGSIEDLRHQESESNLIEHKRLNELMRRYFLARIRQSGKRMKDQKLHQKMKDTWFLTAEEAVEAGLADGIIKKPV